MIKDLLIILCLFLLVILELGMGYAMFSMIAARDTNLMTALWVIVAIQGFIVGAAYELSGPYNG